MKERPDSVTNAPEGKPQRRASIMPEESDAQPAPLEVGQVIVRKYRLDRLLGAGGMGYVALATHLQLDQKVALKFLRPETVRRKDLVKRFALEARAAAKIRGDHVAKVTDVDELEDGTPFMVMEYLEGEDLSERLTRLGRLDFTKAAGYVLEACEAIGEAHAMRIIHRDLKPSNLFLATRPDGSEMVKVLDFGISKMLEDAAGGITQTQTSFGSIPYMAPEQMRDARHCDERTDIWALGVTFYELVTQNYPFPGSTGPEVIARVMEGSLVPVEELRPDATPLVRRIIALCTQRDPSQRYVDIGELALDLAGVVGSEIARERAKRIVRLVQPGVDQLGTLDVDVVRRATIPHGSAGAHPVAQAGAPAPFRAATAPLGPALVPPAPQPGSSAPSSSTGAAAGPVVIAPALSSTGGAPPRSPFVPAMAIGAAVALAIVGVAGVLVFARSGPKDSATQPPPPQTSAPIVAAPLPVVPVATSSVAAVTPAQPEAPAAVDAGVKAAGHTGSPKHGGTTPPATPATQASHPTATPPTVAAQPPTPPQPTNPGTKKPATDPNGMIIKQ